MPENSRVGRTKPKPGASLAPKPRNNLTNNSTLSPFSGTMSNPHQYGAKRQQHQLNAALARASSERGASPDVLQPTSSTRPSKRLKTEAMHRSQSSPAAPTVDLTEDVLPSTLSSRQHAGAVSQHRKPDKAHSTDSDSAVEVKYRSGAFPTDEYGAVHDRINSFKHTKRHHEECGSTQQRLKMATDSAEKKPAQHLRSVDRLMKEISEPGITPDIGTFSPGARYKSKIEHFQSGKEYFAHRAVTERQKFLKKQGLSNEGTDRQTQSPKKEHNKSLPFSTAPPPKPPMVAPTGWWKLDVFSVGSTDIFDKDGGLALAYQPRQSRYEVVNKDGPIVQGEGRLCLDTESIEEIASSLEYPWRVQVLYHRRERWQRFTFSHKSDFLAFLTYLEENSLDKKMVRKTAKEMQNIFQTQGPYMSYHPNEHDRELALLKRRTRQHDQRPHHHQSDHHTETRRERPQKLVSQMRPETEKIPDELEPPRMNQPGQKDRRLTRSTNRIADNGYPSNHWAMKKDQPVVPPPPKLSEDPGFGAEWLRPVVFPSSGRYQSEVCFSDLKKLDDGEFWNDSLISFCMAWSLHQAKVKHGFDDNRIHIFSTFFCTKLWEQPTTNGINYDAVKRWTAKIDLFSRDFIVVPVNDAEHWHLAIIVNMKNADKRPDNEAPNSDETAQADKTQSQSELKTNLIKTLGTGKSGKLSAQSNSRPSSPAKDTAKKRPIGDPNRISILVFDSLGATHPKTVRTLKQYIIAEARSKRGLELTAQDIQGINAKEIPLQPNGYDCGVFVCGYFDKFIRDPDSFVHKVMHREMDHVTDWPDLDPLKMRRATLDTLLQLQRQHQMERREQKKKRLEEAEKKKDATPKEASPEKPSIDSPKRNTPPVTSPPQSSAELSASVQEIVPEKPGNKPLRYRSPEVVIPTKARTPSADPPAKNAAAGTSWPSPEQTAADKPFIKRSNDDDVMMVDRPSKKSRIVEKMSKSPTKKSKSPQPKSRQGQSEASNAESHSAAGDTREISAEFDRGFVAKRPSGNRPTLELGSVVPESPPAMQTESRHYPRERRRSINFYQNEYNPRKVHKIPRVRAPIENEYDDEDDDSIEDPSEVDLVGHPQHQEDQQHQWHANEKDFGSNEVYASSEMQESQQVQGDPHAWMKQLWDSANRGIQEAESELGMDSESEESDVNPLHEGPLAYDRPRRPEGPEGPEVISLDDDD
ncbi:hypothetical protein IWX92DRAFT_100486 [Phyllosticta citricarpa]